MTFGLLTAWQLAALVAASATAIVIIFFLRMRHPRVVVPSLVLWQRVLDERRRDSWIERLRRLISLIVALAIGLLLAFALGDPRRSGTNEGRFALLIDNSATMSARADDGASRLEQARDKARAFAAHATGDARFQVADATGGVLTPPGLDRQAALDAVERIRPGFAEPRVPMMDAAYARVVFTDRVGLVPPAGARIVRVSGPGGNVGITAFEVRSVPARPLDYEAYLSVVNFDAIPRDVVVTIGRPGQPRARRSVRLAAGGALQDVFPMSEFEAGAVEARLATPEDALALDDVAYAWLPDRGRLNVTLVTAGNEDLRRALEADPRVALKVVAMERHGGGREDERTRGRENDTDIFVFDGFTPSEPPQRPSLLFHPAGAPWLHVGDAVARPVLTAGGEEHPVMRAVSFDDLQVARARPIAAKETVPLVSGSNAVFAAAGTAAAPWVAVGFDLGDSNLASQPSFPIFVANVLAWFEGDRVALGRRPGAVHVPWAHARIVDAAGRDVLSKSSPGGTMFESPQPGLFFAVHGGIRTPIAVNLSDPVASDIGRTHLPTQADAGGPAEASRLPLWTWLALAAWVLLVIEWWTWQRRITI
jgi:hypothetical protein